MVKNYSLYAYSLVLGFLCIKIGLGLGIAGSVNIIFLLSAIILCIFYKNIPFLAYLMRVKLHILLYLIVIFLALLSLKYTADTKESFRLIRTDLIFVMIVFISSYIIFSLMSKPMLKSFIYAFGISLIVINIFMLIHYIELYNTSKASRPDIAFFDIRASASWTNLIIPFANWHLIAFSFFLSISIFIRGWGYKLLFISLMLVSIICIAMSGTRTFAICIMIIILSLFLILRYRYKKTITLFAFICLCAISFVVINYSSNWNVLQGRFDIKNMINNFSIVWSKPPSMMGQFDVNCNSVICHPNSLNKSSTLKQDQSSLIRLSLFKSATLAIMQNPLRPNGYGHNLFSKNLESRFFSPFDINYPYFYVITQQSDISSRDEAFKKSARQYNLKSGNILSIPSTMMHVHNQLLSFIFELGIIGFIAICLFAIFQFIIAYKNFIFFLNKDMFFSSFSLFMMLYIIGNTIGMLFDIMLYREGIVQLFILFAFNLALFFNQKYILKDANEDICQ